MSEDTAHNGGKDVASKESEDDRLTNSDGSAPRSPHKSPIARVGTHEHDSPPKDQESVERTSEHNAPQQAEAFPSTNTKAWVVLSNKWPPANGASEPRQHTYFNELRMSRGVFQSQAEARHQAQRIMESNIVNRSAGGDDYLQHDVGCDEEPVWTKVEATELAPGLMFVDTRDGPDGNAGSHDDNQAQGKDDAAKESDALRENNSPNEVDASARPDNGEGSSTAAKSKTKGLKSPRRDGKEAPTKDATESAIMQAEKTPETRLEKPRKRSLPTISIQDTEVAQDPETETHLDKPKAKRARVQVDRPSTKQIAKPTRQAPLRAAKQTTSKAARQPAIRPAGQLTLEAAPTNIPIGQRTSKAARR
ncbi:uncharacterized protein KY384_002878 [Bacidia gigantensis]|uniref:uncharacterized protein n=1 Tax=Bacidia gigantensis TaxID=2732470 RepID=UPI001D0470B8|nr:uncharacterized protein KY384_002878 [Bacidia gigantensis]KAG8532393.1 hypothetical protein KY384_002878 [Bacidia gigantensis]